MQYIDFPVLNCFIVEHAFFYFFAVSCPLVFLYEQ